MHALVFDKQNVKSISERAGLYGKYYQKHKALEKLSTI